MRPRAGRALGRLGFGPALCCLGRLLLLRPLTGVMGAGVTWGLGDPAFAWRARSRVGFARMSWRPRCKLLATAVAPRTLGALCGRSWRRSGRNFEYATGCGREIGLPARFRGVAGAGGDLRGALVRCWEPTARTPTMVNGGQRRGCCLQAASAARTIRQKAAQPVWAKMTGHARAGSVAKEGKSVRRGTTTYQRRRQ